MQRKNKENIQNVKLIKYMHMNNFKVIIKGCKHTD